MVSLRYVVSFNLWISSGLRWFLLEIQAIPIENKGRDHLAPPSPMTAFHLFHFHCFILSLLLFLPLSSFISLVAYKNNVAKRILKPNHL